MNLSGSSPTPVPQRYQLMKGAFAAIIALVVLWIVDVNFNDGRYTIVTARMARSILSQIGIYI
jgi:hypothetical protein